ncbi:RluA family pseudouridine synthase [Roseobacter sp. N2S]|uniref:RluA family pseudouridine synthase n=1 Tax=Roseobacter sp. N2S TaxID=2663844 RepID=UPI002867842E|nr:RluA family pseudouridine synthase [Roseobacter sp. N2S]MDR6267399.1 tRNA pseudouridine32 synthase/23S rRNA pseudouridine746 synthase [Roseobacter sp. N2S]
MRPPFTYAPPTAPIAVLYRDDDLLFVDKPAGLLSVPGRLLEHRDCLLTRLQGDDPAVLLVHRLDMDTSGVMVFARTPAAQKTLNWQFEQRSTRKTYLAEVTGHPACNSGTVTAPLMRDWPNRPLQKIDAAGKPSQTDWRVIRRAAETSFVELTPITGRSHQLRVHMAGIGHAIVGDLFYADAAVAGLSDRLHLHAAELTCVHPETQQPLTVTAPCDFIAP